MKIASPEKLFVYRCQQEKETILSMNFKKSNASSRKFAKSLITDDFENQLCQCIYRFNQNKPSGA